jgi:hypothetical protein
MQAVFSVSPARALDLAPKASAAFAIAGLGAAAGLAEERLQCLLGMGKAQRPLLAITVRRAPRVLAQGQGLQSLRARSACARLHPVRVQTGGARQSPQTLVLRSASSFPAAGTVRLCQTALRAFPFLSFLRPEARRLRGARRRAAIVQPALALSAAALAFAHTWASRVAPARMAEPLAVTNTSARALDVRLHTAAPFGVSRAALRLEPGERADLSVTCDAALGCAHASRPACGRHTACCQGRRSRTVKLARCSCRGMCGLAGAHSAKPCRTGGSPGSMHACVRSATPLHPRPPACRAEPQSSVQLGALAVIAAGALAAKLPLTAVLTYPGLALDAAALDFGAVLGGAPARAHVLLTNPGTLPATYAWALVEGSTPAARAHASGCSV